MGHAIPLDAGAMVPLALPLQGGRVVYLGARVKNLVACGVTVKGILRDAMGKVQVDARSAALVPASDGFYVTDPADNWDIANVSACPNLWSMGDLYGPLEVEVEITDATGRKASVARQVTTYCPADGMEGYCACVCKAGYTFGSPCPG